jgi:hypothetical protein
VNALGELSCHAGKGLMVSVATSRGLLSSHPTSFSTRQTVAGVSSLLKLTSLSGRRPSYDLRIGETEASGVARASGLSGYAR